MDMIPKHIKLVVIDGNIGTAKSTCIKNIQLNSKDTKYTKIYSFVEPLKEWKYYLDKYYKDKNSKNCYEIQIACFFHFFNVTNKIEQLIELYRDKIDEDILIIVERSPIATRYIFIENIKHELGKYFNLLDSLSQIYIDNNIWKQAIYIIFYCSVDIMYDRIKIRNNGSESSDLMISKEYLIKIDYLYSNMVLLIPTLFKTSINTDNLSQEELYKKVLNIIDN